MNIPGKIIKPLLLAFSLLPFKCFAEQLGPHNIEANKKNDCLSCHNVQPKIIEKLNTKNSLIDLSGFHMDGIAMCTACHSEEEGHVVGITLDFSIPADLPLGQDKTISCLTCHYTHGSLESNRPQASYSFMDSLLNSERLHKSFLIRRNNVNGELCLTCHNTIE